MNALLLLLQEKCCGAYYYTDYLNLTEWKKPRDTAVAPISCCKIKDTVADLPKSEQDFENINLCLGGNTDYINKEVFDIIDSINFVIFRYRLHLQKAQHVVIDSNLSLAAVVMFGNIFLVAELWTFDTVVKSTSVAGFKNNLCAVDLSRFLTVV